MCNYSIYIVLLDVTYFFFATFHVAAKKWPSGPCITNKIGYIFLQKKIKYFCLKYTRLVNIFYVNAKADKKNNGGD